MSLCWPEFTLAEWQGFTETQWDEFTLQCDSSSSSSSSSTSSSSGESSTSSINDSSSSCGDPELPEKELPDEVKPACEKCSSCGSGPTNVCEDCGCVTAEAGDQQYSSEMAGMEGDNGWSTGAVPEACHPPGEEDTAVIYFTADRLYFFDKEGDSYSLRHGKKATLSFDTDECIFRFTDCDGTVGEFENESGKLLKKIPPGGAPTNATSGSGGVGPSAMALSSEPITELSRTIEQDGRTITDFIQYTYVASGVNEGLLESSTTGRQINPISYLERKLYTYYEADELYGSPGDLKTVTTQRLRGTSWVDLETSYFRYYQAGDAHGFEHGLKYIVGPEAFHRLAEDPAVIDPLTASNAKVAQYADNYFEYDADHRATKAVIQGGLLTYTYAYTVNPSSSSSESSGFIDNYNRWHLKTVVTQPDGVQKIFYANFLAQVLLQDTVSGSDHWTEYHRYDEFADEVLVASPSAVIGYDDAFDDLDVELREDAGLIRLMEYYDSTTATPTVPGGVDGYLRYTKIQEGTGGDEILQSEITYFERTAGGSTIYPVAESTVFRDEAGTDALTTSYAYTWHSGTLQYEQRTTTYPVVTTAQNGSNTATTQTEIYDLYNNLVWLRDPRGFITYNAYDLVTGAKTQMIQDVDGAKLTLPPGWSTPAGGGLHLITDYEIDAFGRTTQTLGPAHDVDDQSVRTTQWMVYRDLEHETWSGQGYATGPTPNYEYTLVNPVSISRQAADGLSSQSISAVRASTAGKLCDGDCFPQSGWVRWSASFSNGHGQQISSRLYHCIPAVGEGTSGTNYAETTYGYDVMSRQNRQVTPGGTISRMIYDARGMIVSNWVGTNDALATDDDPTGGSATGNNMVQLVENEYDGGADGGDGNLTQVTQLIDDDSGNDRVTIYEYDFRSRQITIDGEVDFYQQNTYDNLDRVIQVDRRNTTGGGNLIARSEMFFDNLGRTYQTKIYAVDPSTGTPGNALESNTWFDASGNTIKQVAAGAKDGKAFTKSAYDGVGRQIAQYVGYYTESGDEPYSEVDEITEDNKIFEQSFTTYDGASNVLQVAAYQRFHDATGSGPLNLPDDEQPLARVSYQAMWYDGVGRTIATANYGTNDNVAFERPALAPERSDDVLVTTTEYNEAGSAFQTVDSAGKASRAQRDAAGRTIRTIANYVAPDAAGEIREDGCGALGETCAGNETNVTVEMAYNLDGNLIALTAKNPTTGDQVTRYEYGVTLEDSALASNNLLRSTIYPDSVDAYDRVVNTYNRPGQVTGMTDQNGTVHEYDFDKLGRPTADRVIALGEDIDDSVQRVARSYEVRGMLAFITNYDAATSGSVVNQVQHVYNNFQQLATQYQEHGGAVNTSTTPKVEYAYADGSDNTIRAASLTYPDGRVVTSNYGSSGGDNDLLSRVASLDDTGPEPRVAYTYLGLGSIVKVEYPEVEGA